MKKYILILCVLVAVMLTGCGDDLEASVTVADEATFVTTENSDTSATTEDEAVEEAEGIPDKEADAEYKGEQETAAASGDGQAEGVSITISVVGDVSIGNHHLQEYSLSFRQAYDQAEDESYFFENVYDIFSADDMTLVNLEGVLTMSEEMYGERTYYIKGDPEYAKILTAGSVEAVSMANNHRLDYGTAGSNDTVAALESENIVYAYDNHVGIYETKGIRIGYVSVNESSQGTAVEKILKNGIDKLKEEGVDLIFACCHWGTEGEYYPEEYQQTLGRLCIDWGADLVIGHHPHVLQGIEEYQGKYIIYSLGNFCFGANRNPKDKDTMIFQQTFTFVDGEKREDAKVKIIPCSVSSISKRNDFKPTPAEGEEAERILGRINEFSKDFGVQLDQDGCVKTME